MTLPPRSYSLPSLHWWLSLNATEQAAWTAIVVGLLAAAGGFAAAWASFRAARIALTISAADARRQVERFARRAGVHAAYIFNEIALVYGFTGPISAPASALTMPMHVAQMQGLVEILAGNGTKWLKLIDHVPASSISELPDECAAATAAAMSSARLTAMNAIALGEKWSAGNRDQNRVVEMAKVIEKRCAEIQGNFQPYLAYARENFGSEIE